MKLILIILLCVSNSYFFAQINLNSSLTACYALNGNANDPISNLTGTLNNVTPTSDRFSNANSAYNFNGSTSSFIKLPNNPLLKPNAISFSCWVKLNSVNSTMSLVFTKNTYSSFFTSYNCAVFNTGSAYKFVIYKQNGSTSDHADGSTTVVPNVWYHVAFTVDNANMKIYVNGILENSSVCLINSFNYSLAGNVIFGGTNEPYNTPLDGVLDNARFYNRLLTANEVNALYVNDPSCLATLPPVASFSISPSLCAGEKVTFTDLSTNNPNAWFWTVPGGTTTNVYAANPQFTFSVAGNYTATLVSSNNSGSDTVSVSFIVNPNPTIIATADRTITCHNVGAWLSGAGALTYSWSSSQSGTPVFVNPNSYTSYTVYGTDENGCTATATIAIKVVADCVNSLSENNMTIQAISIYPNPAHGKFSMDVGGEKIKNYEVFNVLGVLILKGEIDLADKDLIDISNYPNGVYFLKVSNEVSFKTIKIIKE